MENNNKVAVEVVRCAKTYPDGTRGLLATDLGVEPGEVLALLGPSGCGKTTLLRLIAGLESADAGSRILFAGQEVTHKPIEQRGVGMVFQHYALFPQMSVEANIGYGLRIRGVAEAERRRLVGELIELVRLQGLEKKRPAELSGGQRQRVALARAVAIRPRVLLLDEPLTALDAKLKIALRDELADLLQRLQITTIHVTHDQQEALAIADRLAVMRQGKIIQIGRGEDLYRNPGHAFVAEFLGRVNRLQRSPQDLAAGTVNLGGSHLPCPLANRDQTHLLVRPEDIQLGELRSEWGVALVEQRLFLGDHVQLRLRVDGQEPLQADVDRDSPLRAGERIGIWVDPSHFVPATQEA